MIVMRECPSGTPPDRLNGSGPSDPNTYTQEAIHWMRLVVPSPERSAMPFS